MISWPTFSRSDIASSERLTAASSGSMVGEGLGVGVGAALGLGDGLGVGSGAGLPALGELVGEPPGPGDAGARLQPSTAASTNSGKMIRTRRIFFATPRPYRPAALDAEPC